MGDKRFVLPLLARGAAFLLLLPGVALGQRDTVRGKAFHDSLQAVTVTAHALPVERKRDRTIINVEASVVNTGTTVLEVLERSPGVTVDSSLRIFPAPW